MFIVLRGATFIKFWQLRLNVSAGNTGLGNIAASFCDFQVCWRAVLSVNHVGFAIGSIKKRKSLSRQRGKKLAVQGSSEMVVGYKLKFTPPGPQYLFSAVWLQAPTTCRESFKGREYLWREEGVILATSWEMRLRRKGLKYLRLIFPGLWIKQRTSNWNVSRFDMKGACFCSGVT